MRSRSGSARTKLDPPLSNKPEPLNTFAAPRLLRLAEEECGAEARPALAEKLFEAHFTNRLDVYAFE